MYQSSRQFLVSILLSSNVFSSTILLIPFVFFHNLLVSLSGDVEVNPGPNRKPNKALSAKHCNLNNIFTHNFAKLHLLKAYVTVHKLDIIHLSDTYLDYSIPFDDNNSASDGCVRIYYKKFSSLKKLRSKSFRRMYKFGVKNK